MGYYHVTRWFARPKDFNVVNVHSRVSRIVTFHPKDLIICGRSVAAHLAVCSPSWLLKEIDQSESDHPTSLNIYIGVPDLQNFTCQNHFRVSALVKVVTRS